MCGNNKNLRSLDDPRKQPTVYQHTCEGEMEETFHSGLDFQDLSNRKN